MKIYDFRGFPNPLRVRIAIGEKNLTDKVEFIAVNVPQGEHRTPEFLARNPSGLVPVLELEDGTHISECAAITEYLDNLDGRPSLTGAGVKQRAVIHMMQRRVEAGLLDNVATYFHQATPGLGPVIETYQNREWGEQCLERAVNCMRYLDGVLGKQKFVAGDTFSVADITTFAGLVFADFAKIGIPRELSRLLAWRTMAGERPSITNA